MDSRPPLWPQPIPVVGLTGEKWSGKTTFALSITGPDTLIYDTEVSSLSYVADTGATRIDVMDEMHKLHPKGHKPIDRYVWWLNHVRSVPTGKYRVIVCDTVNEIDSGLSDWVRLNPGEFGHTPAQYVKMSGIMWGDVKDHWLSLIASELKGRCETFVFVTHMGNVWGADNKPTGKRKPKGKETLYQVASLYLEMERKKDAKGNLPQYPSAVILKDRVARMAFDLKTGEMVVKPLLPPRLPKATPAEIRRIMLQGGIDFASLKPEQMAPEEVMTDDDRAAVRLATAEAERDTEQARLARMDAERGRQQQRPTTAPTQTPPTALESLGVGAARATAKALLSAADQADKNGASGGALTQPKPDAVNHDQLSHLNRLRTRLWEVAGDTTDEAKSARWKGVLEKRGVKSALELTKVQADELIAKLVERLNKEEPMDKLFRGEGEGSPAEQPATEQPAASDATTTTATVTGTPAVADAPAGGT